MTKTYIEENNGAKQFVLDINQYRFVLSEPEIHRNADGSIDKLCYNLELYINNAAQPDSDYLLTTSIRADEYGNILKLLDLIDTAISFDVANNANRKYLTELVNGEEVQSETDYFATRSFPLTNPKNQDSYTIIKDYRYSADFFDVETLTSHPYEQTDYAIFFGCDSRATGTDLLGLTIDIGLDELLLIKKWAEDFIAFAAEL
ncbi:MAG: hypothetical protein ACI4KM_02800 [Oscillospiraceae bacterium]